MFSEYIHAPREIHVSPGTGLDIHLLALNAESGLSGLSGCTFIHIFNTSFAWSFSSSIRFLTCVELYTERATACTIYRATQMVSTQKFPLQVIQ